MVFELLFGAAVAKALVSEKHHERDELHDRILLDGINAVPIEDVATVVGVSRRHIVLNEYTTTDCQRMMDYAKEHFGTKAYKKFKERLNNEVNKQQEQKSQRIKEKASFATQHINKRMKEGISNQTVIVRIKRSMFLNSNIHKQMMYDLHHNTWWGECVVKEKIYSERLEIYEIKVPNFVFKTWGMQPDFKLDSNRWLKKRVVKTMEHQYKNCLKSCGHDPMF